MYTRDKATDPNLKASLGNEIGKGKGNTNFMLAGCSSAPRESIFQFANRFSGGGKMDWFVPSKSELNELCKYVNYQPTGNVEVTCQPSFIARTGFFKANYWSSSEYEGGGPNAWYQNFGNAEQGISNKASIFSNGFYCRPIRSF